MALTIETGAGVANANSYASVAEARAYAAARALTLPATDADVEALLVKACDFLESLEKQYQGTRTQATNALAWPRSLVYLFDSEDEFPDDEIPSILKQAQCQLAYDANSVDLQPTGEGREVVREKVDVIETEYAPQGSGTISPQLNKAMGILAPLFKNSGGFALSTLRI